MSTLSDVKDLIMRLSTGERRALAEWLSEEVEEKWGVAEPLASYGSTAEKLRPLTIDEFLAFEDSSPIWHEYVAGEIYAMAEPSQAHEIVVSNLVIEIGSHLRGKPCRIYRGSRGVRFNAHGSDIFYRPDIWVACGQDRDAKGEFIDEPRLVVEVLSPSTERTDRREKTLYYREIPTLEEIVLVSQKAARVTILRRSQQWMPILMSELGETFELQSFGLGIPLGRIFEGLP